jgi:hypothetical protein
MKFYMRARIPTTRNASHENILKVATQKTKQPHHRTSTYDKYETKNQPVEQQQATPKTKNVTK